MGKLTLDVECPECGERHRVDLDDDGHFDQPLPCEPESGRRVVGQCDRAAWLMLQQTIRNRTVH